MSNFSYIFSTHNGQVIHSIDFKKSANKKLGKDKKVVQTYHFSLDQVKENALENDETNCMDCPYSFNQNDGKSGGCYTHKGFQRLGVVSKLNKLNRLYNENSIQPLNMRKFLAHIEIFSENTVELLRFGAYGEPVLLPIKVIDTLINGFEKTSQKYFWTGYTHQWHKEEYQEYSKYLMASVHSVFEQSIANDKGFRTFLVGEESTGVNCPASKEAGKKLTCSACTLCSGRAGKSNKNVYIAKH